MTDDQLVSLLTAPFDDDGALKPVWDMTDEAPSPEEAFARRLRADGLKDTEIAFKWMEHLQEFGMEQDLRKEVGDETRVQELMVKYRAWLRKHRSCPPVRW